MSNYEDMGLRRFGRINWLGLLTLAKRENQRFLVIWSQTLISPLITAALFLTVFNLAIGSTRGEVMGVPFVQFLAPGILMMTVVQNAFANTSSAIMTAKTLGSIVDTLMPPLSAFELTMGYLAGGIGRGLFVALAVIVVSSFALGMGVAHPLWVLAFVLVGGAFLGALGIIAGIIANKFDQMAAITNVIVTPLSFLSGTFYSIEALPQTMQVITHINPVFYLIDGVRYGVIGVSDSSPWLGLAICLFCTAGTIWICWAMFRSGYRLKA